MAILGFEIEEIARLLTLVDTNDLEEMILEEDERYLRIRGASYTSKKKAVSVSAVPVPPSPIAPPRLPTKKLTVALPPPAVEEQGVPLRSPMVGTFYRSNQPGAPPLVEVGQHVTLGQTLGLIEAMKVFSELPSEVAGTIVSFPAKDGKMVQSGDVIVVVKPD